MKKTTIAALLALSALAACGKKDNETVDTTTVPGVDTTAGLAMPTTDTVLKKTEVDTIQGEVPRDSVKKDTKSKTTKKPGY